MAQDQHRDEIDLEGNATGAVLGSGSNRARDQVGGGLQHTTVNVGKEHDTRNLRNSLAGVIVRLDENEEWQRRFESVSGAQYDKIDARLARIETSLQDKRVDEALQDRDFNETTEKVDKLHNAVFGNGSLGIRRWEQIDRYVNGVAILSIVVLMIFVVIVSQQVAANSQQIAIILELMSATQGALP